MCWKTTNISGEKLNMIDRYKLSRSKQQETIFDGLLCAEL